ncbi:hypothetical protein KR032_004339, partial [Drosophila birchii]
SDDSEAAAFRRSSKLPRSPPRAETQEAWQSQAPCHEPTPKRIRDPSSPASPQRVKPAKKSRAADETSLADLLELGKLLQEVSVRMMDKTTRHITVSTREMFAKMKALHSSVLEASRAAIQGGADGQERLGAATRCPNCAQESGRAERA